MKNLLSIFFLWATSMQLVSAVGYRYNQLTGGLDVSWQYDDMCGVLTTANTDIIHWVTDGGSNSCEISGYGWALTPNSQYYAYSPYSLSYRINNDPMTALPVSYNGQSQTGNNNANHLNAFDFMAAQALSGEDVCHFDFNHLGCVLRIECELIGKQTLKSMTLSLSRNDFAAEATMNVVNGTLTPANSTSTLSLALNDVTVQAGEKFVAFMLLPPTNLTGSVMNVTLMTADGLSAKAEVKGTEMQQGCLYPISLKMPGFRKTFAPSASPMKGQGDFLCLPHMGEAPSADGIMAKAPIISRVTATASPFVTDEAHCFEQMNILEEDAGIGIPMTQTHGHAYTISGIKATSVEMGTIIIRNGKKYIK